MESFFKEGVWDEKIYGLGLQENMIRTLDGGLTSIALSTTVGKLGVEITTDMALGAGIIKDDIVDVPLQTRFQQVVMPSDWQDGAAEVMLRKPHLPGSLGVAADQATVVITPVSAFVIRLQCEELPTMPVTILYRPVLSLAIKGWTVQYDRRSLKGKTIMSFEEA